jgi:hypothetical protein
MSARVAIATDDRHAGLSQAKFRTDYVNDTLLGGVDIKQLNTKLTAVSPERIDLLSSDCVGDGQAAIRSGDVVIDRTESEIRASHSSAGISQPLERLRRRYLVNEMKIDVKKNRLAGGFMNDVSSPQFVKKSIH